MLTKVEVRTSQGELLILPLEDVSSGFVVSDINGLDPVKATIVTSSFAQLDGSQYHSSKRESRNIILTLELRPDFAVDSVRDLRTLLYQFFMPKSEVDLRFFMLDGLTVDISGRIESFESVLFTDEPQVTISLICFDPDFYDPVPVVLAGNTTSGEEMTALEYIGSVETGVILSLNVDRDLTAFEFYHQPPNDALRSMEFALPLIAGDTLIITTSPGNKGASLVRSDVVSSVLYGVSPFSNWIELEPGSNLIRFYAEGAAVPFTLEYTNKYGGL